MTPTEAHWQEAERIHQAFTGLTWFERIEPTSKAIAQLVADGATATQGYQAEDHEIDDAVAYANRFFDDGRSYSFASAENDTRFDLIASMLASLNQTAGEPLTDTERAELVELRAFKAAIKAAGGW